MQYPNTTNIRSGGDHGLSKFVDVKCVLADMKFEKLLFESQRDFIKSEMYQAVFYRSLCIIED